MLLAVELLIALRINDRFIRPYMGDVLVVVLIYSFIISFIKIDVKQSIFFVFAFSFSIEFTQLFHLIKILNLEEYKVAHWVLGSSFNGWDFVAYSLGLVFVFLIEKIFGVPAKQNFHSSKKN